MVSISRLSFVTVVVLLFLDQSPDDATESESSEVVNMYVFEGKDYSKEPTVADEQVFQQLADGECLELKSRSKGIENN